MLSRKNVKKKLMTSHSKKQKLNDNSLPPYQPRPELKPPLIHWTLQV
jgi:hypothetical protein